MFYGKQGGYEVTLHFGFLGCVMCGLPCWGEARATDPTAPLPRQARTAVQDMPLGILSRKNPIDMLEDMCFNGFTVGVDPRSD